MILRLQLCLDKANIIHSCGNGWLVVVVLSSGFAGFDFNEQRERKRVFMSLGTMSGLLMLLWKVGLLVLVLADASSATLSPTGVNYEGEYLSFFWFSEEFPCLNSIELMLSELPTL